MASYTEKTPEYEIDLNLPEAERWAEVIAADRSVVRKTARQALRQVANYQRVFDWLGPLFVKSYELWGGRFGDEIRALSVAMGIPKHDAFLLNCQYELFHAIDWSAGIGSRIRKPFGCTSAICSTTKGMLHARSMDWDLKGIGEATRLVWFRRGKRRFVSVHILGTVGVLSAMLPRRYSVTINWLPVQRRPTFDFGPSFLLREVLEDCDTFAEAVRTLAAARVSTAVSFSICGAKSGEGAVVEHLGLKSSVRRFDTQPLIQGNHFNTRRFGDCNDPIRNAAEGAISMMDDSQHRQSVLRSRLLRISEPLTLRSAAACLARPPIRNPDSHQQMVFYPAAGELLLRRTKGDR